jgi:hypothetical protein
MPLELESDEPKGSRSTTLRIPIGWESQIQAGMKRLGLTRHAYLLKAIKYVTSREESADYCEVLVPGRAERMKIPTGPSQERQVEPCFKKGAK